MDPKERIPAEWPPLDAREILRRLTAAGIDFVVIGGIAMVLLGYPRITRDLDIAFAYDDENLDALDRLDFSADELEAIDRSVTDAGVDLWAASREAG